MAQPAITQEQIQESAYLMWLDAGQPEGRDQDFWFAAEAALTPANAKKAPAKKAAPKATASKASAASKVVEKVKSVAKPRARKTAATAK